MARKPDQKNGGRQGSNRQSGKPSAASRRGQDRKPSGHGSRRPSGAQQAPDDLAILEGRHAFEEALDTGAQIECVFLTDAAAADARNEKLVARARQAGAKVQLVDQQDLEAISSHGAHQGIAARLKPYQYVGLQQLIDRCQGQDNALIIATDHVTDAGNFGAIVRTAEVVGATGVLIPNKRNARVNTAAYKTSAGAVLHLPIAMEANLVRSLQALKEEGFWVVGASEHADDIIWNAPLSGRIVLVMGSEGDGLSRLTLEACDLLVKLPQAGKVESLNVAQATTAIAYEWMRQCSVDNA